MEGWDGEGGNPSRVWMERDWADWVMDERVGGGDVRRSRVDALNGVCYPSFKRRDQETWKWVDAREYGRSV